MPTVCTQHFEAETWPIEREAHVLGVTFGKVHVLTVLGKLTGEELPRGLFFQKHVRMPTLQRERRSGMEEMHVWVGTALWGRAGVRAGAASYSAQLAGKRLVWLRWKKVGSARSLLANC